MANIIGAILKGKEVGQKILRAYRIKTGSRGKTITRVKPRLKIPGASAKDIERSRQAGHTKVWSQRDKIAKDLEKKVEEGKKAIKTRAHLGQTKVLKRKRWGGYHADPSTGAKGTEPWSPPVKKIRKTKKGKSVDDIPF
jgi:hypothetical protein